MQRLMRMPFAIKNHTRTPVWSGPSEDDEFNIKKSWIREPVRLPLPSSISLNPKEAWEKASLFSLRYEPPSREVGFSGEMVAYQELFCVVFTLLTNSTQPQRRRKWEISKTKSLKLQHLFLAGFFAFIARPTLSNFIEKVMRSSRTLISTTVASSVAIVATNHTHIHRRDSLM